MSHLVQGDANTKQGHAKPQHGAGAKLDAHTVAALLRQKMQR